MPARDVVFVPARDAALAGAAGQIGPGFVGAHVGDEMIGGGEGRFAPGGFEQMPLKDGGVAAGQAHFAGAEAQGPAEDAVVDEAIDEVKAVGDAPGLGGLAVELLGRPANEFAFVAPLPPDRILLDQQAVDGGEQHRGKADAGGQVEHPPPADAPFLAKNLQQHVAIQPRKPGRFDAFGRRSGNPSRPADA